MKYLLGLTAVTIIVLGALAFGVYGKNEESLTEETPSDFSGAADELENYEVTTVDYVDAATLISKEINTELSQPEIDGLVFMREEEKFARDAYLTFYDQWGIAIFNNIADSESIHMEAILTLLEHYNIEDPVIQERGVFMNQTLQELYEQMVAEGLKSQLDAFIMGAKIEDLDINDLETNLAMTNNPDITAVYESLQRGSHNHLRAFNNQILNQTGENYTPEFISDETFRSIISSDIERGVGASQGGVNEKPGGQGKGRN